MLSELEDKWKDIDDDVKVRIGKQEVLLSKMATCNARLKEIESRTAIITKTSEFLQTLSDTTRKQIIDKISMIVTDALQKVKDPNLEFKMVLSTERNQIDLKFLIKDTVTQNEYDIINSCGGSIADIVSFPLRVSLLMKWEPELSKLLILDEQFKYVSLADQEPLAEFVSQLSNKLGLQTLLITHSEKISSKADKVFKVFQKNRISQVCEQEK